MLPDDQYWMGLALEEARLALAEGEFPVGCVLVEDVSLIGWGRRRNSNRDSRNEIDHAEILALRGLFAAEPGRDCSCVTLYSTMEPCLMCFATALLSGIRRFVYAYEDVMGGGTSLDLAALPALYRDMAVEVVAGMRRQESRELFRRFFSTHDYWHGSLLARHAQAESGDSS